MLLVDLREAAAAERGLRCFLSRDEIERAARFQSEGARSRFVLTRGWLRVILARSLDVTPERLTFSYGANGKPALAEEWRRSELSFNVSHSEGYALIGLTTGRAIGVDIEQVRPMPDFADIASGYFSEIEMRALAALPEADRLRGFFRCWTRKEAFMKATGDGMAIALDGFSVSLDDDVEQSISISDSRFPHGDAWVRDGPVAAVRMRGCRGRRGSPRAHIGVAGSGADMTRIRSGTLAAYVGFVVAPLAALVLVLQIMRARGPEIAASTGASALAASPPAGDHVSLPVLSLLLAQLGVVLAACWIVGRIVRAFGQPRVVGEMLAGILLGQSVLGAVAPAVDGALFPAASLGYLSALAQGRAGPVHVPRRARSRPRRAAEPRARRAGHQPRRHRRSALSRRAARHVTVPGARAGRHFIHAVRAVHGRGAECHGVSRARAHSAGALARQNAGRHDRHRVRRRRRRHRVVHAGRRHRAGARGHGRREPRARRYARRKRGVRRGDAHGGTCGDALPGPPRQRLRGRRPAARSARTAGDRGIRVGVGDRGDRHSRTVRRVRDRRRRAKGRAVRTRDPARASRKRWS